jgi:hypothetical protein
MSHFAILLVGLPAVKRLRPETGFALRAHARGRADDPHNCSVYIIVQSPLPVNRKTPSGNARPRVFPAFPAICSVFPRIARKINLKKH